MPGISQYVHRQAEINKPSALWKMHVQSLDIRLPSWASNQVSDPDWSQAKSNSPRLLWRSKAVTNMKHRHHHCAASQEINTAGEDCGPTCLSVMFGPRWTLRRPRELLNPHTDPWQTFEEGDKTSKLYHSATLCSRNYKINCVMKASMKARKMERKNTQCNFLINWKRNICNEPHHKLLWKRITLTQLLQCQHQLVVLSAILLPHTLPYFLTVNFIMKQKFDSVDFTNMYLLVMISTSAQAHYIKEGLIAQRR